MSKNVRTAMERTQTKNDTDRLVLSALASYANKDLRAWPTQRSLARLTGRKVRAVQYALRRLEASGEIRVVKNGQGRRSTEYYLSICASDSDVLESDKNPHEGACPDASQTRIAKQVFNPTKPAQRQRETCTGLHIEEIEDLAPSLLTEGRDGQFRILAEKHQAPKPASCTKNSSGSTSGTVAGRLGDHARENIPGLDEWVAENLEAHSSRTRK